MEFYDFPFIGNVIIPTDELIFFRGVETTNQLSFWKKIEESVWYTYVNYHLPTIKSSVNHH